jgi:hypothetical protein
MSMADVSGSAGIVEFVEKGLASLGRSGIRVFRQVEGNRGERGSWAAGHQVPGRIRDEPQADIGGGLVGRREGVAGFELLQPVSGKIAIGLGAADQIDPA